MEDSESAVNSATAGSGYATADVPTERGHLATSTDMINGVNIGACGHSLGDEISDLNSTQEEATNARTHDTSENFSSSAPVSMDTTQVAAYDSSLNVVDACETGKIVSADITENGIMSDVHDLVPADKLVEVSALSAEEERLWKIVRANSLDFNAWTALIEETEKAAEISKIRKVYDAFLAEFPLCYGYWKKYADHEERLGFIDKVVEVYERAVEGVTYSVDMWVHYSVFAINTYGDPDTIRRLFERGLAYVGSDYLSFPLWDKYIEYEYKQQEWSRLAVIYTRILENPNQQLDQYFTSFRELVAHRPLTELRTAEEAAAAAASVPPADSGQQTEGELHPNVAEQCPKPVSVAGLTEAEELEKYIAIREEMYNKSKELDSKIIGFETSIRRPYFHVPPLGGGELENWHNYLDFIEAEAGDNLNKVVKLYERCLIACANYPEFWIRYVLCMEGRGSMHLAENALARATQVFVKRQPEIHLFAALFRECSGDIPGARAAYQLVHSEISPGLLEAIIKHASMECRLGNVEDACSLYEQTIAIEKGKEHSQTLPLLYAQYSRFVYLACSKVEKSREILDEALENCQLSKSLLEAIIHLESIKSLPKRIDYLDSLVSKFTVLNQGTGSIMDREELSSIFLQFVNLFGDTQSIKKALYRHAKLFLRHKRTPDSKKRHAEDFLVSEKSKIAKSGGVLASSPSVMSTYQSTQNQWAAAGYGAQPQAWPQVAQAQAQNWNTAHPQQATYGAYGSTYAQPQVPTSVPQAAAYGAYAPPMYPVQQAYPQQSYAQAGTLATLTSAQQPAAVAPTAYYDSYY